MVGVLDRLRAALAGGLAAARPQAKETYVKWTITWTNPNGSKDGDVVVAEIKTDPKRPGTSAYTVPATMAVEFIDLFKESVSIGGELEFVVNDVEVKHRTANIAHYDPANPSRPAIPRIVLGPNDTLKINVYVKANNTGSDVTESATLLVRLYHY